MLNKLGRFTGELAQKNETVNRHYKNVKFMCADIASPELRLLLIYLSDKEVELFGKLTLDIFYTDRNSKNLGPSGIILTDQGRRIYWPAPYSSSPPLLCYLLPLSGNEEDDLSFVINKKNTSRIRSS